MESAGYQTGLGLHRLSALHLCSNPGGMIVLDKKYSKLDTYLASIKPMSATPQLVAVAPVRERRSNLVRLGESLARDHMVRATLRASEQDIRHNRIVSNEEALRQLRRAAVLSPQ